MNTYILTFLAASLAAAVVTLLSPKGEGGSVASHVSMIAGLFLLTTLLTPLRAGIDLLRSAADGGLTERMEAFLPEGDTDYDSVLGDTLTALSRDEIKAWVLTAMGARFSVPQSDCTVSVSCTYAEELLTVTEVRIALHGKSILRDPHPMEAYFSEQLKCPCFVTVG
jgi:hypothetical protein